MNTTDTSLTVEGLEPTTDYIFQIRAYTSKGPGPWSNQLPFRTFGQRKYHEELLANVGAMKNFWPM